MSVIGSGDIGTIKLNSTSPASSPKKSVNFGPGIEMLMNEKRKSGANSPVATNINLSDLNALDASLMGQEKMTRKDAEKKIFSIPSINNTKTQSNNIQLKIDELPSKINLAKPNNSGQKNETWDGMKRFNEIPTDPAAVPPSKPHKDPETLLKEKLKYLRFLEALEKKGIKLTKKYTMEHSYYRN